MKFVIAAGVTALTTVTGAYAQSVSDCVAARWGTPAQLRDCIPVMAAPDVGAIERIDFSTAVLRSVVMNFEAFPNGESDRLQKYAFNFGKDAASKMCAAMRIEGPSGSSSFDNEAMRYVAANSQDVGDHFSCVSKMAYSGDAPNPYGGSKLARVIVEGVRYNIPGFSFDRYSGEEVIPY